MPQQNVASRAPIEAWQVENLRLTAFPVPSEQDTESWWADVVGELPESSTSQPRKGLTQQKGLIESDVGLTLTIRPGRIDWLLSIAENPDIPPESFPLIGSFPDLRDRFLSLMLRWFALETCPTVHRLAFGAVLLQPVANRIEGYQNLSSYLYHVQLDPENSFDFSYQINRRRDSTSEIADLYINRLSKWSVATWMPFRMTVGRGGVNVDATQPQQYACRLQLDINTSQDFQNEITREQLPEIFRELNELAVEIVREGDIP